MESVCASGPQAIPSRRRSRYPTISYSCSPRSDAAAFADMETVSGEAYLCFWDDESRFEGHLTGQNSCHYGLVGGKLSDDNYEVTVVDHEDEESYRFERVSLRRMADDTYSLLSPALTFSAKDIYRGHKADMFIQKFLTPRLVGQNFTVYKGKLSLELNKPSSQPSSLRNDHNTPSWCL